MFQKRKIFFKSNVLALLVRCFSLLLVKSTKISFVEQLRKNGRTFCDCIFNKFIVNLFLICLFLKKNRKRHESAIKDTEAKQEAIKESLNKFQQQIQQAKVKMAIKA